METYNTYTITIESDGKKVCVTEHANSKKEAISLAKARYFDKEHPYEGFTDEFRANAIITDIVCNIADKEGWYLGYKYVGYTERELIEYLKKSSEETIGWLEALSRWIVEDSASDVIVSTLLTSTEPLAVAEEILEDAIMDSGRNFVFRGYIYEFRIEGDNLDEDVMEA